MLYDAIILGLGGMGSAALWHLARRGCNVLGIEQFGVAHDRGSSHGDSRLIRRAYFEHPDYVPLVSSAYRLWEDLERGCGKTLFHRTGLFLAGPQPGMLIDGVLRAAAAHRLNIETVQQSQIPERFPGLRPGPEMTVLYEADAGFLEVENCVRAHIEQAQRSGAKIQLGVKILDWNSDGKGAAVETDAGVYFARHLVFCSGAWSPSILKISGIPLQVRRKVVVWYASASDTFRVGAGSPAFCFDTPNGFFYGFPTFEGRTIKIGEHSGGQPIESPEQLDRQLRDDDLAPLSAFLKAHLPAATSQVVRHSVCMYTMTPDEHFIIDRHPHHENVFVACGFSGHGLKFAPVVGSVLADFVTRGGTDQPIGFLSLQRFRASR